MYDSDEESENKTKALFKICRVEIKKLDLQLDKQYKDDFDSSDDELPTLPCLLTRTSSQHKSQLSNKELLEEHENLAKTIQVATFSNKCIEEGLKRITVVEVENAPLSPPAVANEEKDVKVFFVNDTLQYFNMSDITLEQCGYTSIRDSYTEYEKMMLSFKRVELERVLSSFLFSSNICCISDLKSFVTFLLRNLSVHTDVASIEACYNVLNMFLDKHPNVKSLNFSSAEIFMLIFNYGIDINSFKFLEKRMNIRRYLEEPKNKNKSKIPEKWMFNLKATLNAVISLVAYSVFKVKDLCDIIIYLLWLSLDFSLLSENIFSTVRECISASLEQVPTDKWSKVMREVASAFISEDFLYSQDEWKYVYHMAESVPVTSKRGIELRKYISFLALMQFGKMGESPEQRAELNKTLSGFSLRELRSLLKGVVRNGSDAIVSFSTKFLNICISHLEEATEEDIQELCGILKSSESELSERTYEAKARFLKIHARLKLMCRTRTIYKVTTDHVPLLKKVKKEAGLDIENLPNAYGPCMGSPLLKIKEEPGHEFSYENEDEELDFNSIQKSDIAGGIHMDIVSNTVSSGMPSISSCDTHSQEYFQAPAENSIIMNSPAFDHLSLESNLPSTVETNQTSYRINDELSISNLKSGEEQIVQTLPCELGLGLAADFVNNSPNPSRSDEIVREDIGCEFKKDIVSKDVLMDAMAVSHVAFTTDKQPVLAEEVFLGEQLATYECPNVSVNESFITPAETRVHAIKELKPFSPTHDEPYSILPESSENYDKPSMSELPELEVEFLNREGLDNSASVNGLNDDRLERNEIQLDEEITSLSKLVKTLVLPEGTEILPVKKDSTPKKNMDVDKTQATDNGEDIVIHLLENSPNEKLKSNHLDVSELQILFCKPVVKRKNTSKLLQSENETNFDVDEEVIVVTDSSCMDDSTQTKSLGSYNDVDGDEILSANVGANNVESLTTVPTHSDSNDIVMQYVDSSHSSVATTKNDELMNSKHFSPPLVKHEQSIDRDINHCETNYVTSAEIRVAVQEGIIENDGSVIDVAATNETALPATQEQDRSSDSEALQEDTAMNCNSIIVKKTILQEDDQPNVDRNLQYESVHSKLTSTRKVTDDLLSGSQSDIIQDVTFVLNNLITLAITLSKEEESKSECESFESTSKLNDINSSALSSFEDITSLHFTHPMTQHTDLGELPAPTKAFPHALEAKETNPMYSETNDTISVGDNNNKNRKFDTLTNSSDKNQINSLESSNQKDISFKQKSKSKSSKKRKSIEFSSPSSKLQKHSTCLGDKSRRPSNEELTENKALEIFSPNKSHLKSIKNSKSPKKFFDYQHKRKRYVSLKKQKTILTQFGLNLANILREKMNSPSLNGPESKSLPSSKEEDVLSDSDSDIMPLYCNPRNYADPECIITYDSHEVILLDSD